MKPAKFIWTLLFASISIHVVAIFMWQQPHNSDLDVNNSSVSPTHQNPSPIDDSKKSDGNSVEQPLEVAKVHQLFSKNLSDILDAGHAPLLTPAVFSAPPGVLSKLRIDNQDELRRIFQLDEVQVKQLSELSNLMGDQFGSLQRQYTTPGSDGGSGWILKIPQVQLDEFGATVMASMGGLPEALKNSISATYLRTIKNQFISGVTYHLSSDAGDEGQYFLHAINSEGLDLGKRPVNRNGSAGRYFSEIGDSAQFDLPKYLAEF